MGWKGTLRSLQASANRAAREAEREEKLRQKQLQTDNANQAVAAYNQVIEERISLHKTNSPFIDWNAILQKEEPQKPRNEKLNETTAQAKIDNFKPGVINKLLKNTERKIKKLEKKLEYAKQKDHGIYKNDIAVFEKDYVEWKEQQEFAKRVLNGEVKAYIEAISKLDPFSKISLVGSDVSITCPDSKSADITVNVHSEDTIPKKVYKVLKSGKLSEKDMPKSKFYALYQDYVCSTVLRIAGEIFALLPIRTVRVSAEDELLNSVTGHLEKQVILSIIIPRETFNSINLDTIDPSDSMKNFVHEMKFKLTQGFTAVEKAKLS